MTISTLFYITLALLVALGFAYFQYLFRIRRKQTKDYIFFFLRFSAVFIVLLLLIDPKITSTDYEVEKPYLILLSDNSQSISYLEQEEDMKKLLNELSSDSELSNRFEIQPVQFDTKIFPSDSLNFTSLNTDPYNALSETQEMFNGKPSAVVLLTDGNQSIGRDYKYFKTEESSKLFPVVLGDTTTFNDLSITRINVNRYAFLNNQFPVEIFVNYSGAEDIEAKLNIRAGGAVLHTEDISFSNEKRSGIVNTVLPANALGVRSYTVEITSDKEERNLNNNEQKFAIEVIDERTSVLILSDIPHPDLGALKKSIESNEQRSAEIKYLRDNDIEINDFQLIILYQLNRKFNNIMQTVLNGNHNFFMVTGTQTDWYYLNSLNLGFTRSATGQSQDVFPVYNPTFSSFQFENIGFEEFPPLTDKFGPVDFQNPQLKILLYQELQGVKTGEALMAVSQDNPKKGFLLGENLWRWRAESYLQNNSFQEFDNFISKLIQNLASTKTRERLTVDYNNFYFSNEDVIISSQYFDENYQFDPGASLSIIVENSDTGETLNSSLILRNNFYQFNAGSLQEGNYSFIVKVDDKNLSKSGRFEIVNYNTEQQFVSANLSGLNALAQNNNTNLFFPDQVDMLKEQLLNNDNLKPIQKSREKTVPLIDWYYLLFILIVILAAEWFYRKYLGLI